MSENGAKKLQQLNKLLPAIDHHLQTKTFCFRQKHLTYCILIQIRLSLSSCRSA